MHSPPVVSVPQKPHGASFFPQPSHAASCHVPSGPQVSNRRVAAPIRSRPPGAQTVSAFARRCSSVPRVPSLVGMTRRRIPSFACRRRPRRRRLRRLAPSCVQASACSRPRVRRRSRRPAPSLYCPRCESVGSVVDDRSAHATVNGAVSERPPMRPTRDLPCEFHEPAPRRSTGGYARSNERNAHKRVRSERIDDLSNCGWNLC